jgi:very-short-patch-repair endonuclease
MPHTRIARRTRSQAQSLRRSPTDAERKMWWILRSLKPLGMHFRRQAPIGVYIADFVSHEGKLIVEIDGSQHTETQLVYDERRTAWLESQGYRVIRFWNNEVLKTPRSVGEAVYDAASNRSISVKDPTPNPSPQGGGERAGASREDAIQ